jgi:hypothetical protein
MAAPTTYTDLSAAAATLEVRGVIYPTNTIFIPASGTNDTTAIQDALTAGKRVLLSGTYIVDTVLTMATPAGLIGVGPTATIHYIGGASTTSALVTVSGTGARVQNIILYCYFKSRGIRFVNCYYDHTADNVWSRDTRQVGMDFDNCYGSRFSNMKISTCRGMAMRTLTCNTTTFEHLNITGCTLFWHLDEIANENWMTAAKNITLWEYGSANGIAATRTQYGANCVEDWPTTDTGVAGYVPTTNRGTIGMIQPESLVKFSHVTMESCANADYPAIYCGGTQTQLMHGYFEGSYYRERMISVPGTANGFVGANFIAEDIEVYNKVTGGVAVGKAKWFVEATGNTHNLTVNRILSYYGSLSEGIVRQNGAGHGTITVTNYLGQDVAGAEQVTEDIVVDA